MSEEYEEQLLLPPTGWSPAAVPAAQGCQAQPTCVQVYKGGLLWCSEVFDSSEDFLQDHGVGACCLRGSALHLRSVPHISLSTWDGLGGFRFRSVQVRVWTQEEQQGRVVSQLVGCGFLVSVG